MFLYEGYVFPFDLKFKMTPHQFFAYYLLDSVVQRSCLKQLACNKHFHLRSYFGWRIPFWENTTWIGSLGQLVMIWRLLSEILLHVISHDIRNLTEDAGCHWTVGQLITVLHKFCYNWHIWFRENFLSISRIRNDHPIWIAMRRFKTLMRATQKTMTDGIRYNSSDDRNLRIEQFVIVVNIT